MRTHLPQFRLSALIILCSLSFACHSSRSTAPRSEARLLPATDPIVELWNGGSHLLDLKPFLLFAAYADGTILVRGDPARLPHHDQSASLLVGSSSPRTIQALRTDLEHGVTNPPIKGPVLYPDGPEFILIVRADVVHTPRYHGGDPQLDRIGPAATPSRAQLEAFHRLWQTSMARIRCAVPMNTMPYAGPIPPIPAPSATAPVRSDGPRLRLGEGRKGEVGPGGAGKKTWGHGCFPAPPGFALWPQPRESRYGHPFADVPGRALPAPLTLSHF